MTQLLHPVHPAVELWVLSTSAIAVVDHCQLHNFLVGQKISNRRSVACEERGAGEEDITDGLERSSDGPLALVSRVLVHRLSSHRQEPSGEEKASTACPGVGVVPVKVHVYLGALLLLSRIPRVVHRTVIGKVAKDRGTEG